MKAINENNEDGSSRLACGLLSDLAHNIDNAITARLPEIMQCLLLVLRDNSFQPEDKLTAIIAVGDVCLASEHHFEPYIEATMDCLFSAAGMALQNIQGISDEEKATIIGLRKSIVEAFVAVVHGIQSLAVQGSQKDKVVLYTQNMFRYIETLVNLNDQTFDLELRKYLVDLFIDIVVILGHDMQPILRQSQIPRFMRGICDQETSEEFKDVKDRFRQCQNLGVF